MDEDVREYPSVVDRMVVDKIFKFTDGRTVFVGTARDGEQVILRSGRYRLFHRGQLVREFDGEPEMLVDRGSVWEKVSQRTISTSAAMNCDFKPEEVAIGAYSLKGPFVMASHRHLVGIESPADDFVPDNMTLGPRLPEGWDGDAWTSADETRYFLRAWNKRKASFAIGTGDRFDDAPDIAGANPRRRHSSAYHRQRD